MFLLKVLLEGLNTRFWSGIPIATCKFLQILFMPLKMISEPLPTGYATTKLVESLAYGSARHVGIV
jgi:hypothetical protein